VTPANWKGFGSNAAHKRNSPLLSSPVSSQFQARSPLPAFPFCFSRGRKRKNIKPRKSNELPCFCRGGKVWEHLARSRSRGQLAWGEKRG